MYNDKLNELKNEVSSIFLNVNNKKELEQLKQEYLSKNGKITQINSLIREVPNEEKRDFGMKVNEIKNYFNEEYSKMLEKYEIEEINAKLESEAIDVTLPSKRIRRGSKHPMTRIQEELEDLFVSMGYDVYDGPEIETDENCFQKLNLPLGHPARDAQDTFYLENEYEAFLLRSQTSTGQVRAMEGNVEKGPIRIVCPGKVYRRDDDATHSHQFMQMEGLVIDENVSMADLKSTLEIFCKKLLGDKTEVRFRPSFFPFTEPSVEVDVTCCECGGKGCKLCKGTGWIEVLGGGIVNRVVLENCGIDPEEYSGLAFGIGMDRIAMLKYGINNIHILFDNDIRTLKQFKMQQR